MKGQSDERRVVQCILMTLAIAMSGCSHRSQTTPVAGDYPRSSVRFQEKGHERLMPTDGPIASSLPSSVRFDNSGHFAATSEDGEMSGSYFQERDSTFFVQHVKGKQRVVFAGRVSGDVVDVRWFPTPDEPLPAEAQIELRFVRNRASGQSGRVSH